jgi:predicted permease
LPALTFSSITTSFQIERIHQLWPLPVIGLGLVLLGTIAGVLLRFGLFSTDGDKHRTFIHLCAVNNSAYLPIVIIRNIWGESTLANLFFFNIGTTLGVWTIGVGVLGATNFKTCFKNILTPTLASAIISILLVVTGINSLIPPLVIKIITRAGSIAVPLILILVGASLAKKASFSFSWPVIYISIVRLLILPFFSILILRLLPLSSDVFTIAVIVSLMPAAVSSVIMTRRFGGSAQYATNAAFITNLLAIITVPAALWFLFK